MISHVSIVDNSVFVWNQKSVHLDKLILQEWIDYEQSFYYGSIIFPKHSIVCMIILEVVVVILFSAFEYFTLHLFYTFDKFMSYNLPRSLYLVFCSIEKVDWPFDRISCIIAFLTSLVKLSS